MSSNDFSLIRPAAISDNGGAFTRASVGTYWDRNGVLQTAAVNVPRWDHNPNTGAPAGMLLEAAATNLLVQSNNLNAWTKVGTASVVAAAYTSNGVSLDRVLRGGTASGSYLNSPGAFNVTAGSRHVLSGIARSDGANTKKVGLRLSGIYPNRADLVYDFATDTVATATGGSFQDVAGGRVLLSDGMVLLWVQGTPQVTEAGAAIMSPTDVAMASTNGFEGPQTVTSQVLLGEMQLEVGSAYSSRIRTAAAQVTRGAESNTTKLLSNIPEPATGDTPDPAAWSNATAYATGAQVYRATTHKIYQRINQAAAATDATLPENDAALAVPTKWIEVSSTNKWRAFDAANESQSSLADELQMTLAPGQVCDSLAVLNVQGTSVRVQVLGTDYDQEQLLVTRTVDDWLEYFTEPFDYRTDAVFTGLPLGASRQIVVTVKNIGGVAKVGNVVPGLSKALGGTRFGAEAGIIDYSQKVTNQFGYTTVTKRGYSKRMNVAVWMRSGKVDEAQRLLADLRATPLVWVGAGNLYGALIVYGFFRSFSIVISDPLNSLCNLEIEGLA